MSYSTPLLLDEQSRWLAKLVRFQRMSIGNQISTVNQIITVTTNYTALLTDFTILVNTTSGNIIITLPVAGIGQIFNVKKVSSDANTVTIIPTSGTIDGTTSVVISTVNSADSFQFDGANYYMI